MILSFYDILPALRAYPEPTLWVSDRACPLGVGKHKKREQSPALKFNYPIILYQNFIGNYNTTTISVQ